LSAILFRKIQVMTKTTDCERMKNSLE
jgi:hypothetical protein